MSSHQTPSGWTTIEYTNDGEEQHFMIIGRLSEGKTFDDLASQVTPPFNEIWFELRDGEITQEEAFEITGMQTPAPTKLLGGMRMLPEGKTGYFTLDLESGRYLFVAENTGHLGVMQEVIVE